MELEHRPLKLNYSKVQCFACSEHRNKIEIDNKIHQSQCQHPDPTTFGRLVSSMG